jgi:hypothetical protein
MNPLYLDTARLLTQVVPIVFADGVFALKGGTAINLFIRDSRACPSISTSCSPTTKCPVNRPWSESVAPSGRPARLSGRGLQTRIQGIAGAMETKLMVRRGPIDVKVEVNFVMRGTVHPVRTASLVSLACDVLMPDLDIPVVSLEDVYGGKLVAAMGRQHPRDLFDVMQLFAHEGIHARGVNAPAPVLVAGLELRIQHKMQIADQSNPAEPA